MPFVSNCKFYANMRQGDTIYLGTFAPNSRVLRFCKHNKIAYAQHYLKVHIYEPNIYTKQILICIINIKTELNNIAYYILCMLARFQICSAWYMRWVFVIQTVAWSTYLEKRSLNLWKDSRKRVCEKVTKFMFEESYDLECNVEGKIQVYSSDVRPFENISGWNTHAFCNEYH